jgi:hypothetical protein
MGRRQNSRIPDGYFVRGWRFEVETTTPQQRLLIHQHFGARRFAYNWALAEVTDNLHRRAVDPSVPALAWTLPTLRKTWFKARHRDHGRVRFHNGAMRLEPDRRHLTLPVMATLDRRAASLRREAIHAFTTRLARRYGTIVAEDLDVAGMGRRAFRRSVYQAGIGSIRPILAYKCSWEGGVLIVADRWFASSKSYHGCGGYRADLRLGVQAWVCPKCMEWVDRNSNAASNLRDWTGPVADRNAQRGGVAAPVPLVGDHGGQAHAVGVGVRDPRRPPPVAGVGDTSTNSPIPETRNPEQGYQAGVSTR